MNLGDVISNVLSVTTTLDPRMAALLFIICAVGEFGISIPYVLESIWLLVGYQLGTGALSPLHLAGLWLAAQCGRQAGTAALYHIGKYGSMPLARFYKNSRLSRFFARVTNSRAFKRINLLSPFSVAFGRLFGMRVPLTLTMGASRRLKTLSMAVLVSSVIWDTVYIAVGLAVGKTAAVKPVYMFLYSLAGLTLVYLITFLVRQLIKRVRPVTSAA